MNASLLEKLAQEYDPRTGTLPGAQASQRHLIDLRGSFANEAAYDAAARQGNPLLYSVSMVQPASGDGDLHYGLGVLLPGRVGSEYYFTRGHFHVWRDAAEVYIGLRGSGCMLLEGERTGESHLVPLSAHSIVYVPGHTAHRTINTGTEPLIYFGICPAKSGHDYGTIARQNFRKVVVEKDGQPTLMDRVEFVNALHR